MNNYGNCISLTGKNVFSINNLGGKNFILGNDIPEEITDFKASIMDNYIIPLITKRWGTVYDNLFRIDLYRNKLNEYLALHPNADLQLYKNILQLIYSIYSEHIELEDLEKKLFKVDDAGTFAYKTTRIRLKAEYELYNIILGQPQQGEKYDNYIITKIKGLLEDETVSVNEIKRNIEHEFK